MNIIIELIWIYNKRKINNENEFLKSKELFNDYFDFFLT